VTNKNEDGLRVDRWLWFTRFHKTRTLASAAVQGGHVKVNGERAKSGNRVIPGDTVDLVKDRLPYKLTVLSMPARRGPASEMIKCYQEDAATQLEALSRCFRFKPADICVLMRACPFGTTGKEKPMT